ncbi:MAG: hypothetical protein KatS3mg068_1882 [Candidatus Sericytochromatia bacterium]|nr:MAG: hypothetical protein KatS3mg068_1882 [Candidatus Sericytochromatia bacterium]
MLRKIILLVISLFISSCSLGISKIKEDNQIEYISNCSLDNIIKISLIGNAKPFVTSKNIIGRINRFVVPYTRNTTLINIEIDNNSDNDFIFEPIRFLIKIDNNEINYLTLDYFKKKWPTSIVLTTEQLIDQSIAIGEVIRTIVKKKLINKKEKFSFIIPFEKISVNKFLFIGEFKINQETKIINCEFIKK